MIANTCVFLLCCFSITSNIKKIKTSDKQISPIRFFFCTTHKHYVRTVNKLTTYNEHRIYIGSTDRKILSDPNIDNIKKYKKKLRSRYKLEKKTQDIKCSFCVIAKSNILELKDIVENLKSGELFIDHEAIIKRLEEEAKIILRILLSANLETGKWLWIYFLKIVAIRHYDDNKNFIHENPFEDVQLQTSISDFIENCVAQNYLPPNAMEYDLVSNNRSIYNNIFFDLRASGFVDDVLYDRVLTTIEFLYLKPFWDDKNELLFRQITEINVDWSMPKQRHKNEVAITKEFVENRIWMYEPYSRLDHQHLLINIIDARIYCNLSVMLYVYEKQLSILDEQTLKFTKDIICYAIHSALQITGFKDEFLVVILSEYNFARISDINDIKDILASVKTKANEILNDLNVASTSGIDRFSFNVNEHQLSTNDVIIRIVTNFEHFLNYLVAYCYPFLFKELLHFMDVFKISAAQYI